MKKTLMIIAALFVLTSCKTQQPFQVSFGSQGGFTGASTIYTLDEKGKVFKSSTTYLGKTEVTRLKKDQIKEIQELIAKLNVASPAVNTPGNMTSFLNLTKNGANYNNLWPTGSPSGNPDVDSLYRKLSSFIPKQ
jgi:hypothetical protein